MHVLAITDIKPATINKLIYKANLSVAHESKGRYKETVISNSHYKEQVIAEFNSHEFAEKAIHSLNNANFNMKDLSIVGQDYHTEEQPTGYINTGERIVTWGKIGAFWGTIWGILFGSAILIVPGVGSLVFAGWLATTILGGVEGAVVGGGIAALTAALTSIGIPKDSVLSYTSSIKAGNFLVIVRGTSEEVSRAKTILEELGGSHLEISTHHESELQEFHA